MLSLVDYEASDDDSEDDEGSGFKLANKGGSEEESAAKKELSAKEGEGVLANGYGSDDSFPAGPSQIAESLPAPPHAAYASVQLPENELEDLVKPKAWELKLAKKAKRKRKHHHHHHSKNHHHHNKKIANEKSEASTATVKKNVIPAFDKLEHSDDDDIPDKFHTHSAPATSSSLSRLLQMLPQPKQDSKRMKIAEISLPSSSSNSSFVKNIKATKTPANTIEVAKKTTEEKIGSDSEDSGDDDYTTDFFGLKASNETPQVFISKVPYEPVKPPDYQQVKQKVTQRDTVDPVYDQSISAAGTSGAIEGDEALQMIYSDKSAHSHGNFPKVTEALANIVDVSVDQALGPNIQATLLQNLHNKSLTEATLSHLSNLPKGKTGVDMLARRKHQITYLANVAVAREEQLAEQWSLNKHNKRMSAQKYGF